MIEMLFVNFEGGEMKPLWVGLLFLANILVFAVPFAFFEIYLEKFKTGWGGEFRSPVWGHKLYRPKFVLKVLGWKYYSTYHLFMFGFVLPTAEVVILKCLSSGGILLRSFWGIKFVTVIWFFATIPGIMVFEDFLWFALQTIFKLKFPDALPKFLAGEVPWHSNWKELGPYRYPGSYQTGLLAAFGLFITQWILAAYLK